MRLFRRVPTPFAITYLDRKIYEILHPRRRQAPGNRFAIRFPLSGRKGGAQEVRRIKAPFHC